MRKIALLSIFVLVFLLGSKVILADEEVPSDLALDLAQAEKDPAPQRQQIIANETPKAEETTSVGKITVQPETQLAPEVAKQPASLAEHPEQTTSAQVQENSTSSGVNVEQETHDNNNSSSSGAGNLVPGTTIIEPDDNTAPPATPSPSPSPTPVSGDQPVTSSNTAPPATPSPQIVPNDGNDDKNIQQQQPKQPADNSINPPNDNPAPAPAPETKTETPPVVTSPATDNSSQPQTETPSAPPSNTQPDSGNNNSNDNSGGSAVQGISTERIVNYFQSLFR